MAIWQSPSSKSQIRSANNFSKGYTSELSPFYTDENAMIDGYGWDFGEYPAIKTRKGYTSYGNNPALTPSLLTTVNSAFPYLFRGVGTKLEYNDPRSGTNWVTLPGTYTDFQWASTNFDVNGPSLLIVNERSGGFYFKNGTITSIPQMPLGRYMTSDNLRVYVANKDEQTDYIYYSGFQNALDFTSQGNSGTVQFYTPSGGAITGIHSFGGSVWVFKQNAYGILYHTGDSTLAYRLVPMSDTIGCVSANTIAEVGPYIIFLGTNDVYIGSGDSVVGIGGALKKLLGQSTPLILSRAFAFASSQKYYLFLPEGGSASSTLCFVYDIQFQTWMPYTNTAPFLRFGTRLGKNFYSINTTGQVYQMDNGSTDNGAPINWMIQSRPFDEGVKEAEKELWEMHILGRFASGSTMSVQVSPRDDAAEWYPVDYDPIGTSTATQNKNLIVPLDTMPLCNYYSYRLSGTGDVTIQEVQRYSRIQPVQY